VAGDLVHTGVGSGMHSYPFLPDDDLGCEPPTVRLGALSVSTELDDPDGVAAPDRVFEGHFECRLDGDNVTPADDTWRARAITKIVALRPAMVIVSSSDAGDPMYPEPDLVQQWTDGFRTTYDALGASGARVVALLDTPWPNSDAVDCAAMYSLQLDRCASRLPEAIRDPSRRTATKDAARSSGATLIDPTPWLCTAGGDCPVLVGNTVVYRDDSHVADAYAEAIAPVLGDRLAGVLGSD
jgi:hypothetical protein